MYSIIGQKTLHVPHWMQNGGSTSSAVPGAWPRVNSDFDKPMERLPSFGAPPSLARDKFLPFETSLTGEDRAQRLKTDEPKVTGDVPKVASP